MAQAEDFGLVGVLSEEGLPSPSNLLGQSSITEVATSLAAVDFPNAGGAAFLFKMRGVDDGRAPPGYISWVADFPDFLGTQVAGAVPPLIGSLVPGSVVEIARWEDRSA